MKGTFRDAELNIIVLDTQICVLEAKLDKCYKYNGRETLVTLAE